MLYRRLLLRRASASHDHLAATPLRLVDTPRRTLLISLFDSFAFSLVEYRLTRFDRRDGSIARVEHTRNLFICFASLLKALREVFVNGNDRPELHRGLD